MGWTARWHHVSQLHGDGSGHNACAEAAIARWLLEYYPHGGTSGEWGLVGRVLDPADQAATVWALLDRLSVIGRGVHDVAGAPPTSADGIDAILAAFGVPAARDYSEGAYRAAYGAPFGLCNVDGTRLSPARYPAGWIGDPDQPNHVILWLPQIEGEADWFDDPLAQDGEDCRYDLASVQSALYGVWPLPGIPSSTPVPAGMVVRQHAGLKAHPDHLCAAVGTVKAGDRVAVVATGGWAFVRTAAGVEGWLPAAYLSASGE